MKNHRDVDWDRITQELETALEGILHLEVNVEQVGNWLWVEGSNRQYAADLRGAGFKYSQSKRSWCFKPPSLPYKAPEHDYTLDEIRALHGSLRMAS